MGDDSRLQKLLMSEEYLELEDNVLVEGAFIELDKRGDAIKQVLLGITRDSFIVAKDVITDYRKFPSVKYDADVDLDINDLELEWIIPLCYIEISRVPNERVLNVLSQNGRHRYYMLTNIGGNAKKQWNVWMDRVKYIHDDPYGYIKQLYNQWNNNFELTDVEDPSKKNSSITSVRHENSGNNLWPTKYNRRRTRARSIVPENWHRLLGIMTNAKNLPAAQSFGDKIESDNTSKAETTETKPKKKKKKHLRFEQFAAKSTTCSCFG